MFYIYMSYTNTSEFLQFILIDVRRSNWDILMSWSYDFLYMSLFRFLSLSLWLSFSLSYTPYSVRSRPRSYSLACFDLYSFSLEMSTGHSTASVFGEQLISLVGSFSLFRTLFHSILKLTDSWRLAELEEHSTLCLKSFSVNGRFIRWPQSCFTVCNYYVMCTTLYMWMWTAT